MDALARSKQRVVSQRRLSTDDRWNIAALLDEAQVWATLATVPEPLEELEHVAMLDLVGLSQKQLITETFRNLPRVMCPHGYAARASLIREPDQEPRIVHTWHGDGGCPQGCP
jgi:hypothetical protein